MEHNHKQDQHDRIMINRIKDDLEDWLTTHGEVTMAYWIKKPIFIVNTLPLNDMSSWIFSCSDFISVNAPL